MEEKLRLLQSVVDEIKMKAEPKLEVKRAATETVEGEPKAGVKKTNSEPVKVKERGAPSNKVQKKGPERDEMKQLQQLFSFSCSERHGKRSMALKRFLSISQL